MPRLLDLFCGRWGWSRAFAARGWECIGIDKVTPPENPPGCSFLQWDILFLSPACILDYKPDFIVASPPCQEFAKYRLRCFWPDPPYPRMGMELFNHTRGLCWDSDIPYVIENVLGAEWFVGRAHQHCGPFYLWGTGIPPILPQGILKGKQLTIGGYKPQTNTRTNEEAAAIVATIPPELANCVADYAERLLEMKVTA